MRATGVSPQRKALRSRKRFNRDSDHSTVVPDDCRANEALGRVDERDAKESEVERRPIAQTGISVWMRAAASVG